MFRRGELPGRFMARKLFGWLDKQYEEYQGRLERNWRRWKRRQANRRGTLETVREEEEVEQEKSGVREWIKEEDNKIDNMVDLYYELQKIPQDKET